VVERDRWRGIVAVAPHQHRSLIVTESKLLIEDPTGAAPPVELDLIPLARDGVVLPQGSTLTLVEKSGAEPERFQLRAIEPPTFDQIDWPPQVRELVEAQVAASAAARAELRRQLTSVVAWTIAGLGALLVALVVVLLLT
jgi:hypothetical protein